MIRKHVEKGTQPEVIAKADVHGIVLPKAEGGADVTELAHRTGNIPVHAIVTVSFT